MKETDTFLSDLGAEMLAVFNHKIADWIVTNPVELSLNTEGGAGLQLADFQRLEKILAVPVRVQTDFIPNDLMDFDNQFDDVEEQASPNEKRPNRNTQVGYFSDGKRQNQNAKTGHFSDSKRPVSARFSNDSIFDKAKKTENDEAIDAQFSSLETIKRAQKSVENPQILRGGKHVVFEKNKEKHQTNLSQNEDRNDDKNAGKPFFLENETPTEGTIAPIDTDTRATSSSIWQKPLGNLGAFAALSNSEKLPKSIGSVEPSKAIYADEKTDTGEKTNRVGAQEKQPLFENETPVSRIRESVNTQNERVVAPPFFENEEIIQPENIEFTPIDRQGRDNYFDIMTQTDDLFDALTERVRRDFQRFYP